MTWLRSFLILGLVSLLAVGACDNKPPTVEPQAQDNAWRANSGGGSTWYGIIQVVSASAATAAEGDIGDTTLLITIGLSLRSGGVVTVDYATADRSGKAGVDYRKAKGRLTFNPGQVQKTIPISIIGDEIEEPDETFVLQLHVAAGVALETPQVTITIIDDDAPLSGLSERPINATCIAPDRPTGNAAVSTEVAFPNLSPFVKPVAMLQAPGDSSQWYVVEQNGYVLRFPNDPDVATRSTFIDIHGSGTLIDVDSSSNESGLLGMAFHPDYGAGNFFVYLSYTVDKAGQSGPFTSVIARFESTDNGLTLDPATKMEIILLDQPFGNHNGGHILFGPDGYLYIHFGDGGSGGDPGDRAQNTTSLLGTMLRIDVDSEEPYGIPVDNTFAGNPLCNAGFGTAACPEIYAWGLRNAWRWSFDTQNGQLWVADVGQDLWEEVNLVELGGNYGWRCREGKHDFNTTGNCPAGLIDPIIEYDHTIGTSITGGHVYRGSAIPELNGRYVFGDFTTGKIFASVADGNGGFGFEMLLDTNHLIPTFATEASGELLYFDFGAGALHRIILARW